MYVGLSGCKWSYKSKMSVWHLVRWGFCMSHYRAHETPDKTKREHQLLPLVPQLHSVNSDPS